MSTAANENASTPRSAQPFLALLTAQCLSAFNDNLLKNALVMWITSTQTTAFGMNAKVLVAAASGVFILPFFLFSAMAGELADSIDKSRIVRAVKGVEIFIAMVVGAGLVFSSVHLLFFGIFLMGLHSSVLGPVKYGILPELVPSKELVAANARVEMSTFLAILGGTITGGLLVLVDHGPLYVGAIALVVAIAGYVAARFLPALAPAAPDLKVRFGFVGPTIDVLKVARKKISVFRAVLGISFFWFLGAALLSIFPSYARDTLHTPDTFVTVLLLTFCVGIAAGSFFYEHVAKGRLDLGWITIGAVGLTVSLWIVAKVPPPHFEHAATVSEALADSSIRKVLGALFMLSFSGGIYTVPLYTFMQARTNEGERSRVIAANNVLNSLFMVVASVLLSIAFKHQLSTEELFFLLSIVAFLGVLVSLTIIADFVMHLFVRALARIMYRVEFEGRERLPLEGAAVLVANHVSFIDWLIVAAACPRPVRFVMDHQIAKWPVARWLFRASRAIPIAPRSEDQATYDRSFIEIASALREGELVCIFPEGRITKTGEMNEFKRGIERILSETPVPVVPMALLGLWGSIFSRKNGPAMQKLPTRFRAHVQLRVGQMLPPEEGTAAVLEERVRDLATE